MGQRKLYALTDTQADLVRVALVTYENVALDDLDHASPQARRTLAVLRRARAGMSRPAPPLAPGAPTSPHPNE